MTEGGDRVISTRGRYALRVMIDLAEHRGDQFTPLKDIAARQGISKKYLEIIVKDLVRAKMITAASGKGGGYRLCRAPEDYPIGEIIELMEGSLSSVACLADGVNTCPMQDACPTLPLWREYDILVHDFFYGKKLSDLVSPGGSQTS